MSQLPVLPSGDVIRTYEKDYAGTDTESEVEQVSEIASDEDKEPYATSIRLEQNQRYIEQQIASSSSPWRLQAQTRKTQDGSNVILIKSPTAPKLSYRSLNPFLYRNIKNVGSLDDLAALLNSPADWEEKYNRVIEDELIMQKFNFFRSLPDDTSEAIIQAKFITLVDRISDRLIVQLDEISEVKIIVGGILAKYAYDCRSQTDPHFVGPNGDYLLASEVKTSLTFPEGEPWFYSSTGIQVLSTLYAFNSPTFLVSQRQWKLFVENEERNAVLTFPYGDDSKQSTYVNSTLVHQMGRSFIKAVVICLLSQRNGLVGSPQREAVAGSSKVMETPGNAPMKQKYTRSAENPERLSKRLRMSSDPNIEKIVPKFISGYEDGKPVYSVVRVLPQEEVAKIEEEIAKEERENKMLKQTSQETLCE